MLETLEEITETLDTAGIDLVFDAFTIKGIYGFGMTVLFQGNNIVNGTETQEFKFYTSTELCKSNDIVANLNFVTEDISYVYSFLTTSKPMSQIDGWSMLTADYLGKISV